MNDKTPPDLTDEKQVRRRNKKVSKERDHELADLQAVLNTDAGRRLLWRILDRSKLLAQDLFTGNSYTYYNLGKRDDGLWLYYEIMEAAPQAFISMMQAQLTKGDDHDG